MRLQLSQLKKLDACRYLIPRGTKPGMRTDALIYADEALLKQILPDLSLEQAINVAFLPGIVGPSLAMPDIHQGYGFPIGGVAAMQCRGRRRDRSAVRPLCPAHRPGAGVAPWIARDTVASRAQIAPAPPGCPPPNRPRPVANGPSATGTRDRC